MKKIFLFALSALLLASCSEGDYGYYEPTEPYYPYEHSQPPAKTLTGFVIFDYTFDAFAAVPELLTYAMKLDECLSAPQADSAALFRRYFYDWDITSSSGTWKISNREQILIIDTGGKPLSEPTASWNVYCNLEGLYIMYDSCKITHSDDSRLHMRISQGRFADMFRGSADFTVEKRANELSTFQPYLFDMRGTGSLQGILNPDFHIGYSTDGFLRQTEIFWDGTMNVSCTSASSAPDDVRATISADNRVTITYKGITDEWKYTPHGRFM